MKKIYISLVVLLCILIHSTHGSSTFSSLRNRASQAALYFNRLYKQPSINITPTRSFSHFSPFYTQPSTPNLPSFKQHAFSNDRYYSYKPFNHHQQSPAYTIPEVVNKLDQKKLSDARRVNRSTDPTYVSKLKKELEERMSGLREEIENNTDNNVSDLRIRLQEFEAAIEHINSILHTEQESKYSFFDFFTNLFSKNNQETKENLKIMGFEDRSINTISRDELKKQYRTLMKIHHPDINKQSNEKSRQINNAYNALKEKIQP